MFDQFYKPAQQALIASGRSLDDLAHRCGVDRTVISNLIRGRFDKVHADALLAACEQLQVAGAPSVHDAKVQLACEMIDLIDQVSPSARVLRPYMRDMIYRKDTKRLKLRVMLATQDRIKSS